ncbi:hypothetical protein [Aliivibrio wodanis]|uniref:hypothetical protein n=1 Tax=Aliivibrio wodanis TaxID=80852 RepID=UPI00406C14CF
MLSGKFRLNLHSSKRVMQALYKSDSLELVWLAKHLMYIFVSSIAALLTVLMSVVSMFMGGFLIIPAIQTWFIMKYQQGNYCVSAMIAFAPWVGIYFYSIEQPTLTYTVITLACQSAIVGICLYGVRYYVYPKILDFLSSR